MSKLYFNPGCALSIYKPELAAKIFDWLNEHYASVEPHNICCRHDPKLPEDSIIINVCAGCDRRFRSLYEGISTISLWEIIDGSKDFKFPDYHGAEMSIQDPCPVRNNPAVHEAVRSLLAKMNVNLKEPEHHGKNSICCGDSFYGHIPLEEVRAKMKERADSMPCNDVAVYCVSCIKSVYLGGKNPKYIPDLLFSETTAPQEYHTEEWHNQLEEYINRH